MKIELKIDYDGKPYIELYAGNYGKDTLQDLLELFIRRAKDKGVYIKNEADSDISDKYATIRINEHEVTREI